MIITDNRLREKTPNGNLIIWRYLTLENFLDLLLNEEIFFTNLTKLTDKYEGTIYHSNYRIALDEIRNEIDSDNFLKNEIIEEQNEINKLRNYTLVNCWTQKRHESFALWKIYVGNNPGVAIRTTVGNLKKSINSTEQIFDEDISIATVKYQDKLDDSFSRIEATITKKKFYDFESELRLMIFNFPISDGGYHIPYDITVGRKVKLNPELLITELYISPFINEVYRKSITDTLCKLSPFLQNIIIESEINDR